MNNDSTSTETWWISGKGPSFDRDVESIVVKISISSMVRRTPLMNSGSHERPQSIASYAGVQPSISNHSIFGAPRFDMLVSLSDNVPFPVPRKISFEKDGVGLPAPIIFSFLFALRQGC